MRRFELVEGKSSKFWEVQAEGCTVTVRFGRMGANGQTQTKTLADEAAALKEQDKLIRAKTAKGYAEVAVAAGAALAAVAPKEKAAPLPAAPASAPAPAPAGAPRGSLSPRDLPWPQGQVAETLFKDLAAVRGVHCPPMPVTLADLSTPPQVDCSHGAIELERLAAPLGRSWQPWSKLDRKLTRNNLEQPDEEFWLEALAQVVATYSLHTPRDRGWLFYIGGQLHGPVFMLKLMFTLLSAYVEEYHWDAALRAMRHVIAMADDKTYEAAFAVAERVWAENQSVSESTPGQQPQTAMRVAVACLFPHHRPWVDAALNEILAITDWPRYARWLDACVMSAEQARAWLRHHKWVWRAEPTALLQIRLHGADAMPLLQDLLGMASDEELRWILQFIQAVPCPEQFTALMAHVDGPYPIRTALDKLAERYPAAALYSALMQLHESAGRRARNQALLQDWALRLAGSHPAALEQALAAMPADQAAAFKTSLGQLDAQAAPEKELPAWLRTPPWLQENRPQALPVLDAPLPPIQPRIDWTEEEKARLRAYQFKDWRMERLKLHVSRKHSMAEAVLMELNIQPEACAAILAGGPISESDFTSGYHDDAFAGSLMALPDDAQALHIWNHYPAQKWDMHAWHAEYGADAVRPLIARLGLPALPGFEALCASQPLQGLTLAGGIDSPAIARTALVARHKLKKAGDPARQWLQAHPRTAALVALHLAFDKSIKGKGSSQAREAAASGVSWLMAQGHEAALDEAAAEYARNGCPAMPEALAALKARQQLGAAPAPARMPAPAAFFTPAAFARPLLKDGRALPVSAIGHIGSMLQISTLDSPYPGLKQLREICRPDSLAAFAWDVFEAWQAAGSPAKENWAFTALALLGDDETVRRLTPKIRAWPGEGGHARAVMGLDILAAIGSDLALTHLNAMAEKLKFKGLQAKAREKVAAIAQARGLSAAELADRLVPTLGLDESGTLTLDFGPRQFTVAFDEALKPFVKDASGARLKDLPKPVKADDAEMAQAATARYKQLKKDAKAIAAIQIARLELAMTAQRRWSAADFRACILEHPVMRHLAARLVWGVYQPGAKPGEKAGESGPLQTAFRVAEDFSLADAQDQAWQLPDNATVGIAHVLQMPGPLQTAFSQIFADYEILQPFRQLGRETYALTPQEIEAGVITRFADKPVATGSVMGLINRGWERGEAQDSGWIGEFIKAAPAGDIVAELDPGTVVGDVNWEPRQRITTLSLHPAGRWHDAKKRLPLTCLDAITISEALRDIDLMAAVA